MVRYEWSTVDRNRRGVALGGFCVLNDTEACQSKQGDGLTTTRPPFQHKWRVGTPVVCSAEFNFLLRLVTVSALGIHKNISDLLIKSVAAGVRGWRRGWQWDGSGAGGGAGSSTTDVMMVVPCTLGVHGATSDNKHKHKHKQKHKHKHWYRRHPDLA